jgi:hypothetical protein
MRGLAAEREAAENSQTIDAKAETSPLSIEDLMRPALE